MKHITLAELEQWRAEKRDFQLIDVRTEEEHLSKNIGGILIELEDIIVEKNQIETDKPVIIYCKRGIRSQIAIQKLERKFDYQNLYNLQNGIQPLLNSF